MTVRLRPHHLLCMLTYVGEGYGAAFVANYDRIAARLSAGEDALIVEGPDDICAPLLGRDTSPHCHNESVRERDRLAARDLGALIGRPASPGASVRPDPVLLATMRAAFAAGSTRTACIGCEWRALCDRIAASGFPAARVDARPARERA